MGEKSPGYPGGPNLIPESLKVLSAGCVLVRGSHDLRNSQGSAMLLALEVEEGVVTQEMWVA